jgi:hypothetical protein
MGSSVGQIFSKGANCMVQSKNKDNDRQTMPERYSDEWFEMMDDWEANDWNMVQEYQCLLQYREVQARLQEFNREVQHRIYNGA